MAGLPSGTVTFLFTDIEGSTRLLTGEGELRDGQYLNQPLNRCARLMGAAHGGQVVMSESTAALGRGDLPAGVTLLDLGEHRFRDVDGVMHVFVLATSREVLGVPDAGRETLRSLRCSLPASI